MSENNNIIGHQRPGAHAGADQGTRGVTQEHAGARPSADPLDEQWYTVDETYGYLVSRGVPRSRKTIRKRCLNRGFTNVRKEATLHGERWLIAESALDEYVKLAEAYDAGLSEEQLEGAPPGTPSDTPGRASDTHQGAPAQTPEMKSEDASNSTEVARLKKELMDAQIEAKAAHQVRDFAMKQVEELQGHLSKINYRLGSAETQLKSLTERAGERVDNHPEEPLIREVQ